jgi:AcrR family transcriptional regulator
VAREVPDTRSLILSTAMGMFVDQGYDKTSLREIAEAVGVTKAALYYHFRTKDDIVKAAFDTYRERVADLVGWVEQQPRGRERLEGMVDRLADLIGGDAGLALRFGQSNPTVVAREGRDAADFTVELRRLIAVLAGSRPSAEASMRATLSFGALVIGSLGESPVLINASPAQRRTAARKIALEILEPLA